VTRRPLLLDLFCGAGGCAVGYHRAGFDVVGVDHRPQPRYPFPIILDDALETLRMLAAGWAVGPSLPDGKRYARKDFAAIHASPPCQRYSRCRNMVWVRDREYPDLLPATLAALQAIGRPWVVENVPGAPLPFAVELCGTAFGLRLRRHRLFASSLLLLAPTIQCRHRIGDLTLSGNRIGLLGTEAKAYACADGSTRHRRIDANVAAARQAMGIDWMTRAELMQAIPPAFTEYLGHQLLRAIS
jgi:DNA (cytosine-5)-methyltransferase 1